MTASITKPKIDTRPAQAVRVADYLEQHPYSTNKEIDAACDTGSVTKVLSEMQRMGYGISSRWCLRDVVFDGVKTSRRVRTYALTHRPSTQPGLFDDHQICDVLNDHGTAGQLPATFD